MIALSYITISASCYEIIFRCHSVFRKWNDMINLKYRTVFYFASAVLARKIVSLKNFKSKSPIVLRHPKSGSFFAKSAFIAIGVIESFLRKRNASGQFCRTKRTEKSPIRSWRWKTEFFENCVYHILELSI